MDQQKEKLEKLDKMIDALPVMHKENQRRCFVIHPALISPIYKILYRIENHKRRYANWIMTQMGSNGI